MKHNLLYLLLLLGVPGASAQTRQLNLTKGNSQLFRGAVYSYGFSGQNRAFCIYRLSPQLKITDSLVVAQLSDKSDSYLRLSSDTLHDFLNIYLQKKDKKLVTVLRFNKKFELAATIDDIDVARLNGLPAFESGLLYAGRQVYIVKSQADSSGRQFYLNKLALKSELSNFDYAFAWQFAFERKNVNSAHVFYANRRKVLLYVNVNGGTRAGQWILSIDAASGRLIRGTRLNEFGVENTYAFGSFMMDTVTHTLRLSGQKFTEAQLKVRENRVAIANVAALTLYFLEIDSLGEVSQRQEFKLPIHETAGAGTKKTASRHLLRISSMKKDREGAICLEADLFRNNDASLTFLYAGTSLLRLLPSEEQLVLEKTSVSSQVQIEKFYMSTDKTDRNGKIRVDSLSQFEQLFYQPLNFPVKQGFKTDGNANPAWILKKSLPKQNSINYTVLAPVKKIYQLTQLEEIPTDQHPAGITLSPSSFLIGRQLSGELYQLKLYSW